MVGEGAHAPSRSGVFVAVALLSAGVLGYEILLARLLAIVHWHHFAYMIIAVALLGFGAAGSLVAVLQQPLLRRFRWTFGLAALGFGVSAPLAFALAQSLPFNALEIAWDRAQPAWLFALYLVLSVPFLSAALALALAFRAHAARAGALYRMDLVGAGLGALGMVFLLDALPLADALRVVGALGAVSGGIVLLWGPARRLARGGALLALAAGLALPAALPDHWLRPHPSPYKGLSLALTAPDARIVAERHGPLGWLAAVESPAVPFRHAPGLSLMAPVGPPAQVGLFTDGGAASAITPADADMRYLEAETAALPYHLLERPPRVLVLGAGGGAEVLRALHHGARTVDAVELNPDVLAVVREVLGAAPGAAWGIGNIRTHVADARSFAARSPEQWDLIQIALVDSFSAAAAGVHALDESLLYTVEALETFLDRLAPDGVLAVTRWLKLPPRDALKLLWTARQALEARGVADAASRLVMIRGWKTTTLVIGAQPFGEETIAGLRAFSDDYAFDPVWHPGLAEGDANRHNRLAEPEFYRGAAAMLGPDPEDFAERYKFALRPATDDRPFFFHSLKWATLPELLALRAQGGLPLVEWGFVILVATLVQGAIAAALLILLPLLALRTRRAPVQAPARWRVMVFFASLGLAFLFIEIAFMQRFAVFLGHPLYAIAVVLAGLLVFAGLGSGATDRLARLAGRRPPIPFAAAGIIVVGGVYVGLLPWVFEAAQGWPVAARIVVALALLGPIGFLLGMPFPLGLKALGARAPSFVPWAWGINACASVVSASLATFIALHIGFTPVLGCALVLYALAAAVTPQAAADAPR